MHVCKECVGGCGCISIKSVSVFNEHGWVLAFLCLQTCLSTIARCKVPRMLTITLKKYMRYFR